MINGCLRLSYGKTSLDSTKLHSSSFNYCSNMSFDLCAQQLPSRLYRRFLMLTDAWEGVRANPGSLLIKCYAGGAGLPFFWSGTPDNFPSFYAALGNDRSIYGLSSTYGVIPPSADNIGALAKYYAAEIIKVQPQGPYLLGGYCEAALISYAIAKLLLKQGHAVGALILFDRDVTDQTLPLKIARRVFKLIENLLNRRQQFSENPWLCIKDFLLTKQFQLLGVLTSIQSKLSRKPLEKTAELPKYTLSDYPGVVDLIYVKWGLLGYFQFAFFQRYWHKKALGGMRIEIIPGFAHHNPDWPAVAEIARTRLKQAGF
jgi:hypothetical protein